MANHHWYTKRCTAIGRLDWDVDEMERGFVCNPHLWRAARQRATEIEERSRRAAVQGLAFYTRPSQGRPSYLERGSYGMVARFRCGAEARAEERWRSAQLCGVCGKNQETRCHLLKCVPDVLGRTWEELIDEEGTGLS